LLLAMATLLEVRPARADGESHPEIAVRAGVGSTFGRITGELVADGQDLTLPGTFSSLMPSLAVEAGWRFGPLFAAATASWSLGHAPNAAAELPSACAGCTGSVVSLGAELLYRFDPGGPLRPWLGFGAGYEWLSASGGGFSTSYRGVQLANLQVGLDVRVSRQVLIGPFASFALGQFDWQTVDYGYPYRTPVQDRTLHEVLVFGLRVTLEP
jgi:hypothetical protein